MVYWSVHGRLGPTFLQWSSTSISLMGFHLSNGVDTVSWQASIEQINSVLASWTSRQLSFQGRALVTNTFGLSIFWYLSSFLSMPDSIVSRINSHTNLFIWNKKQEWLACTTIIQRPFQGGLGLVDLKHKISALHVMWIRCLVEHSALSSLFYFKHYLRAAFAGCTDDQILMLPSPSQSALELLPAFYRSVMESWLRLTRSVEDGEIVVSGPGVPSCSLCSITNRYIYRQLSHLDLTKHRCREILYLGPDCRVAYGMAELALMAFHTSCM